MCRAYKKSSRLNRKLLIEARGRGDPEHIRGLLQVGAGLRDDLKGCIGVAMTGLDHALVNGNAAAALVFLEAAGCDPECAALKSEGIVPTGVSPYETMLMARSGASYLMTYIKGGGGDAYMTQLRTMAKVIKTLLRCKFQDNSGFHTPPLPPRRFTYDPLTTQKDCPCMLNGVDSMFELAQWIRDESLAAQLYFVGFRNRKLAGTVTARQRKFVDRAVLRHALRRHVATRCIALYWQERTAKRKYAEPSKAFEADMEKPVFTEGKLGA